MRARLPEFRPVARPVGEDFLRPLALGILEVLVNELLHEGDIRLCEALDADQLRIDQALELVLEIEHESHATGHAGAEVPARAAEHDLEDSYYPSLLTGATGLPPEVIDTRIANYENLGAGAFQLTPSVKYDDYAASPVHRFYQMWQQTDCSVQHASVANPSGCRNDLFAWVEVSVGHGGNGKPQPLPVTNISTGEGSTALAFYNVQQGDAPYLAQLADRYTLSDNMHQSMQGGTGANHIMFGFADAIWYSDGRGHPATPPADQIENPDPAPGSDNWYEQDGYTGGSYSACADLSQPGVPAVVSYLQSLPRPINPRCEPRHYYLLNNYNPGFNADGTPSVLLQSIYR